MKLGNKILLSLIFIVTSLSYSHAENDTTTGKEDRRLWVNTLVRIADPVLVNLANNTLKKNMPLESLDINRAKKYSYLEAVGRTICGISPWLELGGDNTDEGKLRSKYIALTLKGLSNAVNPSSPDYLDFVTPSQPLVDAAFLAQGLLRAQNQLWNKLDDITQKRLITEFKRSRSIEPGQNNWLLFASMIEATILEFTGDCDFERLTYGIYTFRDKWYKGDGIYGDGPNYHADYYNSFVIHPMLTDVLRIMKKHNIKGYDFLELQIKRHSRYAEQLERLISPEGAYPVIGRSIVYRVGAFHALTHASLLHILPESISPSQVRCALTAVISRQFSAPMTFDDNGWLHIGFAGNQRKISEFYINTGSSYLCSTGFLALGIPENDSFWSDPFMPWTGLKVWSGEDIEADHAIKY